MNKTSLAIIAVGLFIGGAFVLSNKNNTPANTLPANNVSIVDGKQIVEITVKGGYYPRKSIAQAGIPATVRFVTAGTFDCSSSVRIPQMGISKYLPQSGTTDIDIGSQSTSTLNGSCSMGMYAFEIDFKN